MLRETLEASIIVSVLLSLVENLVDRGDESSESTLVPSCDEDGETRAQRKKRLVKRMKLQVSARGIRERNAAHLESQIWAGAGVGLLIALAIGAAFIAVFFTTLSDASPLRQALRPQLIRRHRAGLGQVGGELGGIVLAHRQVSRLVARSRLVLTAQSLTAS